MKYTVKIDMNTFESDSRDSKKHLQNHGGEACTVFDKSGKIVSAAQRDTESPLDAPKYYNVNFDN